MIKLQIPFKVFVYFFYRSSVLLIGILNVQTGIVVPFFIRNQKGLKALLTQWIESNAKSALFDHPLSLTINKQTILSFVPGPG